MSVRIVCSHQLLFDHKCLLMILHPVHSYPVMFRYSSPTARCAYICFIDNLCESNMFIHVSVDLLISAPIDNFIFCASLFDGLF